MVNTTPRRRIQDYCKKGRHALAPALKRGLIHTERIGEQRIASLRWLPLRHRYLVRVVVNRPGAIASKVIHQSDHESIHEARRMFAVAKLLA